MLGDCDGFLLVLLPLDFKALLSSVLDNHLTVIGTDCVQDVKEELSVYLTSLTELRGKVSHQLLILGVVHIEILHVYLRPLGYINHRDVCQRDQLLVFGKDLSQEVFSYIVYRR